MELDQRSAMSVVRNKLILDFGPYSHPAYRIGGDQVIERAVGRASMMIIS